MERLNDLANNALLTNVKSVFLDKCLFVPSQAGTLYCCALCLVDITF